MAHSYPNEWCNFGVQRCCGGLDGANLLKAKEADRCGGGHSCPPLLRPVLLFSSTNVARGSALYLRRFNHFTDEKLRAQKVGVLLVVMVPEMEIDERAIPRRMLVYRYATHY